MANILHHRRFISTVSLKHFKSHLTVVVWRLKCLCFCEKKHLPANWQVIVRQNFYFNRCSFLFSYLGHYNWSQFKTFRRGIHHFEDTVHCRQCKRMKHGSYVLYHNMNSCIIYVTCWCIVPMVQCNEANSIMFNFWKPLSFDSCAEKVR